MSERLRRPNGISDQEWEAILELEEEMKRERELDGDPVYNELQLITFESRSNGAGRKPRRQLRKVELIREKGGIKAYSVKERMPRELERVIERLSQAAIYDTDIWEAILTRLRRNGV